MKRFSMGFVVGLIPLLIAASAQYPDWVRIVRGPTWTVTRVTVANSATDVVTASQSANARSIMVRNIGGTNDVYCKQGTAAGAAATTANGAPIFAAGKDVLTLSEGVRGVTMNCITTAATSAVAVVIETD